MSDLKHFSVGSIREWAGRCGGGSSRWSLIKKEKGAVPIPTTLLEKLERRYQLPFSMEGAAFEDTLLKKMLTENWSYVLIGEKRNREVLLKLCNQRFL